jgi:hypothetical protein
MSTKEKGEELFCALHVILDAVSSLNLRDLEAEAKANRRESSSKAAAQFSKGKDKVAEPDWEDIPFNPVPITPLSNRPRFTQVVGSSLEAMSPPRVGGPSCSPRRSPSPSRSPSHSDGDGDGGGLGGAQSGGGAQQQPLAYNTAALFLEMWDNCATDVARQNLEQQAISHSPIAEVQLAAMVKMNLRLQATVGTLTGQVGAAQAAAATANQTAVNAQAVATAAGNVDRFRPAAPPRFWDQEEGRGGEAVDPHY